MKLQIKEYYTLTKPGIIRGNVMTAAAGFFFASAGSYNFSLLFWLLLGVSCIIASACVINNYIDRDIDKRMDRTKNRALVTGKIRAVDSFIFAGVLGVLGFLFLALYTNVITFLIGIVGMFFYVVVYGYYKRNSVHGTLIGGISGATSLVAGYCAVIGRFDSVALLLFIIMAVWQMPHFYAIGVYRVKDYAAAKLPILPVVKGIATTKKHILAYIVLYAFVVILLAFNSAAGITYSVVMLVLTAMWLRIAIKGLTAKDDVRYGHQIFGQSLLVLLAFSVMISVTHYLP